MDSPEGAPRGGEAQSSEAGNTLVAEAPEPQPPIEHAETQQPAPDTRELADQARQKIADIPQLNVTVPRRGEGRRELNVDRARTAALAEESFRQAYQPDLKAVTDKSPKSVLGFFKQFIHPVQWYRREVRASELAGIKHQRVAQAVAEYDQSIGSLSSYEEHTDIGGGMAEAEKPYRDRALAEKAQIPRGWETIRHPAKALRHAINYTGNTVVAKDEGARARKRQFGRPSWRDRI